MTWKNSGTASILCLTLPQFAREGLKTIRNEDDKMTTFIVALRHENNYSVDAESIDEVISEAIENHGEENVIAVKRVESHGQSFLRQKFLHISAGVDRVVTEIHKMKPVAEKVMTPELLEMRDKLLEHQVESLQLAFLLGERVKKL